MSSACGSTTYKKETVGRSSEKASANLDEACEKYPSLKRLAEPTGKAAKAAMTWAFTERPESMEDMLSDLIKQAHAKPGRIGQRPMPREEEVNLDALLHGDFTEEPLHIALPKLVKISQRAFCAKIYMNRRLFQLMLLPPDDPRKHWPDQFTIQRIADAVGKPPSYFLEWRQMAATAAFVSMINQRPGIATHLYKNFLYSQKYSPFLKPPGI